MSNTINVTCAEEGCDFSVNFPTSRGIHEWRCASHGMSVILTCMRDDCDVTHKFIKDAPEGFFCPKHAAEESRKLVEHMKSIPCIPPKPEESSVLDIINEETAKTAPVRTAIFRAVTRIRIRDRKAADSKITRAISDFESIIMKCKDGDPPAFGLRRVDWLKTIDSMAHEGIRRLKP